MAQRNILTRLGAARPDAVWESVLAVSMRHDERERQEPPRDAAPMITGKATRAASSKRE